MKEMSKLKMKVDLYIIVLLVISIVFFFIVGGWLKTENPYTDFLLTIAVVHFVVSKFLSVEGTYL